jgi:hypothetical protein
MSNVNNYKFARQMDQFNMKVLIPQKEKISKAETIMHDTKHQWKDEAQKVTAGHQLDTYKAWLLFYQKHYDEGMELVKQHENIVNLLSKWYDTWYQNISNEGKQETELMSSQADMLAELMGEIYKELAPLRLEGMKPPNGMNL